MSTFLKEELIQKLIIEFLVKNNAIEKSGYSLFKKFELSLIVLLATMFFIVSREWHENG